MISIALSFDSGILLCAAAKNSVASQMYSESTSIFPKEYGAKSRDTRSIFVLSEPIDCAVAAVQYCEHALDIIEPAEFTIDRMRAAIDTEPCSQWTRSTCDPCSRLRPRRWTASGNIAKDALNAPRSSYYTLMAASREFSVSGRAAVNCQNWRPQRIEHARSEHFDPPRI